MNAGRTIDARKNETARDKSGKKMDGDREIVLLFLYRSCVVPSVPQITVSLKYIITIHFMQKVKSLKYLNSFSQTAKRFNEKQIETFKSDKEKTLVNLHL